MTSESPAAGLLHRIRAGDQAAAQELFQQYSRRLIGLARQRLNSKLQAKVDAEDVMQSVFRSFFRRHGEGEFSIPDEERLWGLLAIITVRKCGEWADYFGAQCRDVNREMSALPTGDDSLPGWQVVAADPTPSQAFLLTETLTEAMRDFDPREQEMVTLALQGYDTHEIGREVSRSERTVRRLLDRFRSRLEQFQG